MKEEDKLLKKVGTGNPFTAPDGYFEQLTSEVMNKLPEQEAPRFVMKEVTMWDRVKPWAYMAAMFVGAALIIKVASRNPDPFEDKQVAGTDVAATADSEVVYDGYIDYAVNQSMLDDYALYMYLTDASVD
ncbi:MAG: hypothetical protein LBF17_03705 [Mediterranea sp.]|jgi:hypothetical protein|nr:hypothetical protein [Mediterranea sp.]